MKLGKRHLISIFCLCSSMMGYIGRINLSTAIIAMSNDDNLRHFSYKNYTETDACPDPNFYDNNINHNATIFPINVDFSSSTAPRYDWDQKTQGIILGAFFYGYFPLQIVNGQLAEKIGPRILCSTGLLLSGIINLSTPYISKYYGLLIASRILLGASQASIFPSSYALTALWIPDNERSTINSMVYIGSDIGTIIASSLSGYLCRHGFAGGWPSVFYVSGTLITIFSVIYFIIVRDDPSSHWMVSDKELKYIQSNIKNRVQQQKKLTISWMKLIKNKVIWAGAIAHFTMVWSLTVFILKVPEYMHDVLRIPLKTNGFYTALMYASEGSSLFILGMITDRIIKSEKFNKSLIRKICQSIAQFGGAFFILMIPVADCNEKLFLFMMIMTMICNGAQSGGAIALPSDLSNEFSATIFGLFNSIGMINGFICPYIIGYVLDSDINHIKHGWWIIIYLTAALRIFGGIDFLLFVSFKRQSWNKENLLPSSSPAAIATAAAPNSIE